MFCVIVWIIFLFFYVQISPYTFHVCVMWTGKIFSSTKKKKTFFSHFVIADFMHITHFSFFFSCLLFFRENDVYVYVAAVTAAVAYCNLISYFFFLHIAYIIYWLYLLTYSLWVFMHFFHNNGEAKTLSLSW